MQRFLVNFLPTYMHSLSHYQHHSPEWYISYRGWSYITSRALRVYLRIHSCVVYSMGLDKYIITYIHHYTIQSVFTTLRSPLCSAYHLFPSPPLPFTRSATTDLFTVSSVLAFRERQVVWITQCVAFLDWLLSPSNMYLRFLCVFSCLN